MLSFQVRKEAMLAVMFLWHVIGAARERYVIIQYTGVRWDARP